MLGGGRMTRCGRASGCLLLLSQDGLAVFVLGKSGINETPTPMLWASVVHRGPQPRRLGPRAFQV